MKVMEIEVGVAQALPLMRQVLEYDVPVCLLAADDTHTQVGFEVHVDGTQTAHRVYLRADGTWCMTTEVEV